MASDTLRLLKLRFERALSSYQEEAFIQKKLATRLAQELEKLNFVRVLEIGVGAGLLTREMFRRFPKIDFYLALDLLPSCNRYLSNYPVHFLVADGQDLSWLKTDFDLVVSNATFQWFHDPAKSLRACGEVIKAGGLLAFSTFGPLTMKEIRRESPSLLLSWEKWKALRPNCFKPLLEKRWCEKVFFDHPLKVLKHIKSTGALGYLPPCWSLKEIKTLFKEYEHLREERGYPLTYESFLLIWQKQ